MKPKRDRFTATSPKKRPEGDRNRVSSYTVACKKKPYPDVAYWRQMWYSSASRKRDLRFAAALRYRFPSP
jgi:hypothetical protein